MIAYKDIIQYIPEFTPGLAVIDWEEWLPLCARNWASKDIYRKLSIQCAKEKNPRLFPSEADSVARQQFENAARAGMEKTMQLEKHGMHPNYLWGFYPFPKYYNYGRGNQGHTGECPGNEKSSNNELIWLWVSSTALLHSGYLPVSLREQLNAALFVQGPVKEAVRVSAPIYVYLHPVFIEFRSNCSCTLTQRTTCT